MLRTSMTKVPKSALKGLSRYWGEVPLTFFERAGDAMAGLGYQLCEWGGQDICFLRDVSDDVRVVAVLQNSVPQYADGIGACDISMLLWSKLIAERSSPDDPWMPGPGAKVEPYLASRICFHRAHLSGLKWAQAEAVSPTCWPTTEAGLEALISDYRRNMDDAASGLIGVAKVIEFIETWSRYRAPAWVSALSPGTRFSSQFIQLLRSH